jgi:hypothetical protein
VPLALKPKLTEFPSRIQMEREKKVEKTKGKG